MAKFVIRHDQTCAQIPERVKAKYMEELPIKVVEKMLETQGPLKEVNLGSDENKRPAYISTRLSTQQQKELMRLLLKYKDLLRLELSYEEMPGLSRKIIKHRLPIKMEYKPYKQVARRFEPSIILQIKNEIKKILKIGFIRTAYYIDWISNIMPV